MHPVFSVFFGNKSFSLINVKPTVLNEIFTRKTKFLVKPSFTFQKADPFLLWQVKTSLTHFQKNITLDQRCVKFLQKFTKSRVIRRHSPWWFSQGKRRKICLRTCQGQSAISPRPVITQGSGSHQKTPKTRGASPSHPRHRNNFTAMIRTACRAKRQ